jgi:Ca2+-binding EF-hand superfamily protein
MSEYREKSSNGTLIRDLGNVRWSVDSDRGLLVLSCKDQDGFGFVWSWLKQLRTVEQQVKSVEFSTHFLDCMFTFRSFRQDEDPFLGHCTTDPKMCLAGIVDPLSCVLREKPLSEDVMPIHDFEGELHQAGLQIEDIVSDLSLLDRDEDGNLSCEELVALGDLGKTRNVSALEDLHTLRQGLLETFKDLESAFESVAGSMSGRCSRADFIKWMSKMHGHSTNPAFCQWAENQSVDDFGAVFESVDIDHDGFLNWTDFESLHLCSALLTLRQVDHFCRWLGQSFKGSPEDTYRRSFMAIDIKGKKELTEEEFLSGVSKQLGYHYEKAAQSVWYLVDRNFDHKVTIEEFMSLKDFTSKSVLGGLEDLRVKVVNMCGSLKKCYDKMLDEEQRITGDADQTFVSFGTFASMCKQLGIRVKLDLRTLFLFLDEVTGDHGSGQLTRKEWMLLQGFQARSVTGHPVKLRKALNAKFGSLKKAFQKVHAAWLLREPYTRLQRLSLERSIDCYFLAEKESRIVPRRGGGSEAGGNSKISILSGASGGNLVVSSWEPPVRRTRDWKMTAQSVNQSLSPRPYKLPGVIQKPADFRVWSPRSGVGIPRGNTAVDWGGRACNGVVPSFPGRR